MRNFLIGILTGIIILIIFGAFFELPFNYFGDVIIRQDSVVVVRDTIQAPPIFISSPVVKVNIPDKYIAPKKEDSSLVFTDSIHVQNDSTDFTAKHTLKVKPRPPFSALSEWDVKYKPIVKYITKTVLRDSIIYRTKEALAPFYRNTWFYSTAATFILLVLSLLR